MCPHCDAFLVKRQFYFNKFFEVSHQKVTFKTIYICISYNKVYFEEELDCQEKTYN